MTDDVDAYDKIAAHAGLTRAVVERVLAARLDFLFALGLAHGAAEDATRGERLREKYPDLLRASVVETAGRSLDTLVTFELEATIVQLESGEPAATVVAAIAAEDEVLGLVEPSHSAAYREWGARWASG
jgi:hypothetical protein